MNQTRIYNIDLIVPENVPNGISQEGKIRSKILTQRIIFKPQRFRI
jgi:hypothetical protein